jgi:ubiquinone/menaquinone biosynthesis C-methylase UbiE
MNIENIYKQMSKPDLYEKGNSELWTDTYISKQLLKVHLNTQVDLASRRVESIKKTADWILKNIPGDKVDILDLGCGPGLYAEIFAKNGHKVTGLDFSENSINHAIDSAKVKNLSIKYQKENYLELSLKDNSYDLVVLIFTDFGVLSPSDRQILLSQIKRVLRPGGLFIFDALRDTKLEEKIGPCDWESATSGFWGSEPYLRLSNSFLFEERKVILYQHCLITESKDLKTFRFWTHFFSHSDLSEILQKNSFSNIRFHDDVLPEGGIWNGDNVTFCISSNA